MRERVNLFDPAVRANPYPVYAELRRDSPVCQIDPGGVWAVTRYRDAEFVLKHPELFSSAAFRDLFNPSWCERNPGGQSMFALDPPEHGKQRALVTTAFSPRSVARLDALIVQTAEGLADDIKAAPGEVDFVEQFAAKLPARIICELLGLDPSFIPQFRRWNDDLFSITPVRPSDERVASVQKTLRDMTTYLTEVVNERRRAPREDVVSDLVRAEIDGAVLSDDDILAFLFLLLPAGLETTTHLLSNAVFGLTQRPGELARLRQDQAKIPAFIEEVLRHDAPAQSIARMTTAEVTIGGVTLPPQSVVFVMLGSANRDETVFPDPDRFDIERGTQGGLAFGHGIHFCLGAMLSRLEGRAGMRALCSRFSDIERLPGELHYNQALTARGLIALPLRFTLA